MRPQETSQGLAPTAGLAKQIEQPLLIFCGVFTASDFQLDLAAQCHCMNHLFRVSRGKMQLKSQQRSRGIGDDLDTLDLEIQIRHAIPVESRIRLHPLQSIELSHC